ncbi:threonine/serine dehydratase [Aestuariivirga sp.]|uniref:threonine ammonia-lyase n=1 Tax=Aestuariivirga sp. TaxID=2650926 RepID=UPI003918D682
MLPDFSDIEKAARRLERFAVRTPVIESPKLNAMTGGRILIKAECLQRTGSFKFRGAWNRISQLDAAAAPGGVVAYSSGNHAQGVAAAAEIRGLPALIVMPADTPRIKQDNARSYGAEVITYDRATQSREEIAQRYVKERGAVLVPPFDDPDIIAGQGTAGLELAEEAASRGVHLDDVLVCCSGGGLTAGVALAVEAKSPGTKVHTVEPEGFEDYARSLASGRIERNEKATGSICDALMAVSPGEMTFAINKRLLGEGLAVSDAEAAEAVRFAFEVLKLVAEPGGAVALAAVLTRRIATRDRAVGVILSGGNCDAGLYARILKREI